MGKSLTEVAKSVLMNESNDASPDRDAKLIPPNKATLRPGAGLMEPNPMSNEAELVGDAPKSPGEGENVGAKAAKMKQDTSQASPSRKGAVPAQPAEKMMAEEEELDENQMMGDSNVRKGMKTVQGNAAPKSSPLTPAIGDRTKMGANSSQSMNEEEELELSEELEAFIDELVAEGYNEEEIAQAIEENFEIIEEEALEEDVDYEYSVDMSEHVAALFAGEELSEEFQAKAIAIFEAAVTSTVKSELAAIEEAYAATLEEEVNTLKEELSTNVDDYLNYVVENWVAENEVAIEAGLRTELTEEFISGLRNLFAENYIDIPEDKISVVEEMGNKVAELEEKLNEEIERNVQLNAILSESKKTEILYNVVEGLTVSQAEKLKTLAENVEFVSDEDYAQKVMTLRESYFPSSVKSQTEFDSVDVDNDGRSMISEELNGPMARYVATLGKKLPN